MSRGVSPCPWSLSTQSAKYNIPSTFRRFSNFTSSHLTRNRKYICFLIMMPTFKKKVVSRIIYLNVLTLGCVLTRVLSVTRDNSTGWSRGQLKSSGTERTRSSCVRNKNLFVDSRDLTKLECRETEYYKRAACVLSYTVGRCRAITSDVRPPHRSQRWLEAATNM